LFFQRLKKEKALRNIQVLCFYGRTNHTLNPLATIKVCPFKIYLKNFSMDFGIQKSKLTFAEKNQSKWKN